MHKNVLTALQKAGVKYTVIEHAKLGVPINSPMDFAQAIGFPIERITKTVLFREKRGTNFVLAVSSIPKRMNLTALSEQNKWGKLELASPAELEQVVGYPRTGVSPFGVSAIPVVIDCELLKHDTIVVGGGQVGVEIEVASTALFLVPGAVAIVL